MNAPFFVILAVIACFSYRCAFAQEQTYKTIEQESFQRYDSLEREMFLTRHPLIAFGYNNLKVFGGSHAGIMGIASVKYLPDGLPLISPTNESLAHVGIGWGLKMFLGNILFSQFFDYANATWKLPPQGAAEMVQLSRINANVDIGYAVLKHENISITPCVGIGFSVQTFNTNPGWKIYTGRDHLSGAVDMTYFVPLVVSPFHSLEQRKLGIQEIIETMISVRLGFAQHFESTMSYLSTPTHQEFSMRVMVGIGTHKFVEDGHILPDIHE